MKTYYVYILSNRRHTVLYVGVTNDLEQRVFEHKTKSNRGFTAKFNCDKLLYFEEFGDITVAIRREKEIKKFPRKWKVNLVNSKNKAWADLSFGWYSPGEIEFGITLNRRVGTASAGSDKQESSNS